MIGFAVVIILVVGTRLHDWFDRPNIEGISKPTGIEDTDEYMQKIPDPRTGRFTQELSHRYFLYHYEKEEIDPRTGLPGQVYVKAGQNQYIAFVPATPEESDSSLREGAEPATAWCEPCGEWCGSILRTLSIPTFLFPLP